MLITTHEKRANQSVGQLQTYQIGFLHQHPLTLEPNHDFGCYACHSKEQRREGFVFRCHQCGFNIHLECTSISKDEQLLTVSTHQHPLIRFINVPKDSILCQFCGKYCSEPTYACFPCNFFLHPSCYNPKFPREIKHFYHTCPLLLYPYNPDKYYRCICRACYQSLQRGAFYYGCVRCGFEMHLDCALLATTTDKSSTEEEIQHFLHGHPLSLIKDVGESSSTSVTCYACRQRCTNIPTYACFYPSCRNKVYICTTCKELPKEICHPFHPYHTLTLLQQYNPDLQPINWTAPLPGSICNVCRKDSNIVVYICQSEKCNFHLHVGCSEIRASIQYEGRNHLLHVKKIIDGQVFNCSACMSTTRDSYAFSCLHLKCDFNLHLMCGPLPSTIKHKCHVDHLILTQYSLATFENEEDDEFYCDACEEERDPLLPIYQCQECKFAAEVNCVMIISEVILSLQGEYGDVELRNPNGQHVRMITKLEAAKLQMVQVKEEQLELDLNLYGILKSLSEDEKNELGTVLEAIERERDTAEKILSCDPDEVVLFSDKAYKQFIQFLDDHDKEIPRDQIHQGRFLDLIEQFSSNLGPKEEEPVKVSGYTATQKLVSILKHLLSTHGDISDKSSLSPKVKGFLFHMLCEYIYNMKNIMVVDITHNFLINCSAILKTLQREGFRIQFVVDHFKRISCAHFGLYTTEKANNALYKIDRDIEALKVKHERITYAKSTKSSFIQKCLREALSLKRWRAGGLP